VVVVTVQSIFRLEIHQNKKKLKKIIFDINISKCLHRVSKHTPNPTIKLRKKTFMKHLFKEIYILCSQSGKNN